MRTLLCLFFLLPSFARASSDTIPLQSTSIGDKKNSDAPSKGPTKQTVATSPSEGLPYIASIDTYGSSRINEKALRELLGKELDTWVAKGLANDPSAVDLEKKSIQKIKAKYGFPFIEWSIIQYFQPGDMALRLTLDVVEEKDVGRRMPFLPAPKDELADPDGLIAQWLEYENTALGLVESGELEPEAERCAALHCPFGHKHPKLKKFEKIFFEGVKKNAAALLDVQKRDKRGERRAAASYLLAYWIDQKKQVVDAMLERSRDPDALVRNNSIRVLGDIAEFHPDVVIPVAPLLPVMDFPRVSDRSKALFVVFILATASAEVRAELLKTSVPLLIALMECQQPDHRELAHNILRKISGKDFGDTDAKSWLAWYRKTPESREISKKTDSQ